MSEYVKEFNDLKRRIGQLQLLHGVKHRGQITEAWEAWVAHDTVSREEAREIVKRLGVDPELVEAMGKFNRSATG